MLLAGQKAIDYFYCKDIVMLSLQFFLKDIEFYHLKTKQAASKKGVGGDTKYEFFNLA